MKSSAPWRRACPCRARSSRSPCPARSWSGRRSFPCRWASPSRKLKPPRCRNRRARLSRRTVHPVSASPPRSDIAIRKCASSLRVRSAIIAAASKRLATGDHGDLGQKRMQPLFDAGIEEPVEHLGAAAGGNRAGMETGRTPLPENRGPCRGLPEARSAAADAPRHRRGRGDDARLCRCRAARVWRADATATPALPVVLAARSAIRQPFASGKVIITARPGIGLLQVEPAAVKGHHRLGQAETQTGAGLRSALLEPHEALGGPLAVGFPRECRGRCPSRSAGFPRRPSSATEVPSGPPPRRPNI